MSLRKCVMSFNFLLLAAALGCAHDGRNSGYSVEGTGRTADEYADRERESYSTATTTDSRTSASENKMDVNAAASEVNAYNFVEIRFDPGSAQLTESAKASLDAVLRQAQSNGKLDEALVLSWADEEYPSKEQKKLSKYQRDLADDRNKAVKDYVKSAKSIDVDSYNMASQPNILQKWFNTTDNKLKNSLQAAGLPTTADSTMAPGKASHSVILIKIE